MTCESFDNTGFTGGMKAIYKDKVYDIATVDLLRDFEETNTHYLLHLVYEYRIEKSNIISVRNYELCEVCKYEYYQDGCHNCH